MESVALLDCAGRRRSPATLASFHQGRAPRNKGLRYPPEYGASVAQGLRLPDAVKNDSVVLAHSLVPEALRHVFAGYRAMLAPELPLSRRQHEMIAATASILNDCYY